MTISQLAECLEYADKKSVEKIISKYKYLKKPEFSIMCKVPYKLGGTQNTRIFTEDGIYEITMLAKTEIAKFLGGIMIMTFITIVAIMGVLGSAIYNDDLFIMLLIPFLFYIMIKQDDFKDRIWLLEEKMGVNKIPNNINDNSPNNSPNLSNSLSDKKIMKALERCFIHHNCTDCPQKGNEQCLENAVKEAFNLINRTKANERHYRRKVQNQKKEIKRLHKVISRKEAETKKLQDEYRWLDQESDILKADVDQLNLTCDELNTENESLKAEVEQLQKSNLQLSPSNDNINLVQIKNETIRNFADKFLSELSTFKILDVQDNFWEDIVTLHHIKSKLNDLLKDNVQSLKQGECHVTPEQSEAAYNDEE